MRKLQNVDPTPEQLPFLVNSQSGFRMIRGAAGSGKSTAALLRLGQLCGAGIARRKNSGRLDPLRVLVLSFNRTLRGYLDDLIKEQISISDQVDLTVETFGRWSRGLIGNGVSINKTAEAEIERLLNKTGVPQSELSYFKEEVQYILGRFPPGKRKEYLQARRLGRGRAPLVSGKRRIKLLNEVIKPYTAFKSERGFLDWHDLAAETSHIQSMDYDVVVVDEAQDFSANQIRAVLAHLAADHSTTFVFDASQRIYPHRFLWQEVGIEMQAHMVYALRSNYRNTKQIGNFASSLIKELPEHERDNLPNFENCCRSGPLPEVVAGNFSSQLDHMLHRVSPHLLEGECVAILHPKGGRWFDFTRKQLKHNNIEYCELSRKLDWPEGAQLVALSTISSAKGLEFDHVLIPGLNQEVTPYGSQDGDGTLYQLLRLLAMGITRARNTVSIGYKPLEESKLIEFLDPDTFNLIKV